jgi:hypothetical protein
MSTPDPGHAIQYEGIHCDLAIRRPARAVTVVVLSGSDIGEFGDLALQELHKDLDRVERLELFIDARAVRGATIDVSSAWALWLHKHRQRFTRLHMLTGSRYVQVTTQFVRRFFDFDELMTLYTEPAAFQQALDRSCWRT